MLRENRWKVFQSKPRVFQCFCARTFPSGYSKKFVRTRKARNCSGEIALGCRLRRKVGEQSAESSTFLHNLRNYTFPFGCGCLPCGVHAAMGAFTRNNRSPGVRAPGLLRMAVLDIVASAALVKKVNRKLSAAFPTKLGSRRRQQHQSPQGHQAQRSRFRNDAYIELVTCRGAQLLNQEGVVASA
jgi:hypothetical protein